MEYRHASSPSLSRASCGSPYYDSEFTNGSPGQCSVGSESSMDPSQLSPGALQKEFSVFDPSIMADYSSCTPQNTTAILAHDIRRTHSPCSPIDSVAVPYPLSPSLPLGAGPSSLIAAVGIGTPSAVQDHAEIIHTKYQKEGIKSFNLPSMTVDVSTTQTPYSDATKPKKPAKEGRVKRPMNPFMVWSQGERRLLTAQKPELHNADISKHLGQVWKNMSPEEKQLWRDEADRLRAMHEREYPDYKYKPRKNKNKVQKKPVKTESGRVSKPRNRDTASKATKPSARKSGSKRTKGASGGAPTTSQPVSAEVNSSLVSMLQAAPQNRFQPIGVVAASPNSAPDTKQFNRIVIDDSFRKGVRDSQKLPSSIEVTPPAATGDYTTELQLVTPFYNPAFRPADIYGTPTPSPITSSTTASHPQPGTDSADMPTSLPENMDYQDTAPVYIPSTSELRGTLKPANIVRVGNSIHFEYDSGASVTYNPSTREERFNNLAPIDTIEDLSDLDLCPTTTRTLFNENIDQHVFEEITAYNSNTFTFNWDSLKEEVVSEAGLTFTDADIQTVSEKMPETIFADPPPTSAAGVFQ